MVAKAGIAALLIAASLAAVAQAPTQGARAAKGKEPAAADRHREADIARHRQMAAAHESAARCLQAGTDEKQCHQQLREACKGIGVGQYCGMRHAH